MNRNNKVRWVLLAVFLVLAAYYFYPTARLMTMSPAQKDSLAATGELTKLKNKALRLGLDLQGGMYLQLEVDLIKLMDNLAHHKDAKFEEIKKAIASEMHVEEDFFALFKEKFTAAGISLNRYFGDSKQTDAEIMKYIEDQSTDAINRSLEVLRNRIDQFGLTEPSIMKRGQRRIIIELPGVSDPQRARALIGKTAQLEFTLVAQPEIVNTTFVAINKLLKGENLDLDSLMEAVDSTEQAAKAPADGENTDTSSVADRTEDPTTQLQEEDINMEGDLTKGSEEEPFTSLFVNIQGDYAVSEDNQYKVKQILQREEIQKAIPPDLKFLWARKGIPGGDGKMYYKLYLVKKQPALTGEKLKNAFADVDQGYTSGRAGQPIVSFELNRQGGRIFARVTGDNINHRLAIVLDDFVFMAPNIRSRIPGGRGYIEGMENMDAAKDLAIVLRAGALPAPVHIIEERTVGPSLGRDSIRKGAFSAIMGLAIVMVFMIFYYKLAGAVAVFALLLNLFFLMGILSGFNATLTLPGIAGIILTIGMAVDANVLIFERIREELRLGKTVRTAIESGFDRAFTTIMDANITTLIAGVVLYQFGTGPIKGFALTLMIGIVVSMYTAIVVSHLVFDYFYSGKDKVAKMSI
jgi:preprotein translocase subunit SecD